MTTNDQKSSFNQKNDRKSFYNKNMQKFRKLYSTDPADYDAIMKNINAIAIALTNGNFNAIAISNNG